MLAAYNFADEGEAVAPANDTPYGLVGAVWTKDIHRGHRIAAQLRTDTVWVNCYRAVAASVPFGGLGLSGAGRENGAEAVTTCTETKSVWIELTHGTRDSFTVGRDARAGAGQRPTGTGQSAAHSSAATKLRKRRTTGDSGWSARQTRPRIRCAASSVSGR